MTEGCPRCPLPFDTVHSAAQHLWKSQDEDHDDVKTLDAAIEAVMSYGKSPDENHDVEPSEAVAETTDDEPPATVDADPSTTARADGGTTGLGLEGPPETVDDVEDDDVQDASDGPTVDCPHCGEDTGETPADLEAGKKYRCTDCEKIFRWNPDQ